MSDKTGFALRHRLQSAQDYDTLDVNIFLSQDPAARQLETAQDDGAQPDVGQIVKQIRAQAAESQSDLVAYLKDAGSRESFTDDEISVPAVGSTESFWVTNAVAAEVSRNVLEEILRRPDVIHVELERHADLEALLDARRAAKPKGTKTSPPKGKGTGKTGVGRDANRNAGAPTWSAKRINAPLLWQAGITGTGILAAIIDTGVNYHHPDLKDRMWDGGTAYPHHGYNFDSNNDDPVDEQGHGTSCAGLVAGDGTSGTATGVAPGVTIVAVRVGGKERTFWRGYEFAISREVQVISSSMSWKYPSHPDYPGWRRICESVLAARILHSNSVGNQGGDLTTYPVPYNIATPGNCPPPRLHPLQLTTGGLSSVISCGATDDADQLAGYSGRGPAAWETGPYLDYPYQSSAKMGLIKPDVCAPGPGTTSCNWLYKGQPSTSPYSSFGGTSAATPHVGGCLALLANACRQAGASIVPARIQEAIENTAIRVVGQTRDKENHYGAGRVDVYAAYKYGQSKGWW